jgi:poly(A) polymerase Pap1
MPDEVKSTACVWKPSCDPTKKMKQKKKKGKKVKVEITCDSFFNFFRNIDPNDEKAIKKKEELMN